MARKHILKCWIFISFCICQHRLHAQIISNDNGASDKHFIYEVKEIDEFFERFNDAPNSFPEKRVQSAPYQIQYRETAIDPKPV